MQSNFFFLLNLAVRIELFPCAVRFPQTHDWSMLFSFQLTNVVILFFHSFLLNLPVTLYLLLKLYLSLFLPSWLVIMSLKLFQCFSVCSKWTTRGSQMPESGIWDAELFFQTHSRTQIQIKKQNREDCKPSSQHTLCVICWFLFYPHKIPIDNPIWPAVTDAIFLISCASRVFQCTK